MHHTGIATRENTVDTVTQLAAKALSHSYREARIAVVAPAGIAASTTETAAGNPSSPARRQPANTARGITTRRIRE